MSATQFRKKPVVVDAVQWTGDNLDEIFEFTGCDKFDFLDEQQRRDGDDPEATAAVFDVLHSTWVLVYDGQWIIRGVKGEFYPCAADVFRETYEPVPQPLTVNPIGFQGPAQHTWTFPCDGFHEPGPCPPAQPQADL